MSVPARIGDGGSLIPANINEAMQIATAMANSKMVPKHLQGDVGTCYMVVEISQRWRMSPFQVGQGTSNIGGKICYEGKTVAAAIYSAGAITSEFDYDFTGDEKNPETLSVVTTATRASDGQRKSIELTWAEAHTDNKYWRSQPKQQLVYASSRVWGRRWTPGVLLGVFAPEEMRGGVPLDDPTIIDARAEPPETGNVGMSDANRHSINYPINLPNGDVFTVHTGTEFLAEWRSGLIKMGTDKQMIRSVRELNRASLTMVAGFDPQAAAEVEGLLNAALKEPSA